MAETITPYWMLPPGPVTELEPVRFEQSAGGDVIEGRAMPYDEWTMINAPSEGSFMERFAPSAFAAQIRQGFGAVRVMFEHGEDKLVGRQIVAKLSSLSDLPGRPLLPL
jgi:phage head maturation protease